MPSEPRLVRALLVEDDPDDALLLRLMLGESGLPAIELIHASCVTHAEQHLADSVFDIILLDLGLPDAQGLGAVRRAHAAAPHVRLVVLSGTDDESVAVKALQEGASDFLVKGQIDSAGLVRALQHVIDVSNGSRPAPSR